MFGCSVHIRHTSKKTGNKRRDNRGIRMKKTVIAIVGPTAVGKTKLSIEVAKQVNGEIISGDSMQVYKYMDIGTAKVTKREMHGIPHHMIDTKEPDKDNSVSEFQHDIQTYINDIKLRNKLYIIVMIHRLLILP